MITKTLPAIVRKVAKALGDGMVIHHEPIVNNALGQSGTHTFVNDIMDIYQCSTTESDRYRNLMKYLIDGQL